MDAAGSRRAAVFATADGVPLAIMFAAAHPERVTALVLYAASARLLADIGYPIGIPTELQHLEEGLEHKWANELAPYGVEWLAPSVAEDPRWRRSLARMQRLAGSPRSQQEYIQITLATDVRGLLGTVSVPTLVMGCSKDLVYPIQQTRFVADHIDGARYVEIEGTDHLYWFQNGDVIADEVEEFLTGARHVDALDRVLATVLFTDIVGSTELTAAVGDRRWRDLVEQHYRLVRRQLDRFRGTEVDTAGDGFFATFDGPARAIRCAQAIHAELHQLGISVRAGLDTGECERIDGKVGGITVNIGARIAACASAGETLVSRTIVDLVAGSGIRFIEREERILKGVPGIWKLYGVDT